MQRALSDRMEQIKNNKKNIDTKLWLKRLNITLKRESYLK